MNDGKHICQVAFSALNASALRRWYQEAFRFLYSGKILFLPPSTTRVQGIPNALSKCGWLIDRQDYFQLEFFQFVNPKSQPRRRDWKPSDIGYNILGIHATDFDDTLQRLKTLGTDPLTPPQGEAGDRRVCVKDPEGNVVELFESDPYVFGAGGVVRNDLPPAVRSMVVSVPDLEKARQTFADALGLLPVEGHALHDESHESLWGLDGAKSKRLLLRSDNLLVELVQYLTPEPCVWPAGYRICDQGFMNIALGYPDTAAFDRSFRKAVEGGLRPNGKPLDAAIFKVMYVNDAAGFSVEMLNARKMFWSVTGFNPSTPYVENEVWIDAAPEAVWAVLTDHDAMGDWCLFKGKVVRQGTPEPNGKGTRRQMRGLGMKILEEITEWEPNQRFTYTVLAGGGVKDYRGDLMLIPEEGGTRLRWSIRFKSRIPGGGKPAALLLGAIFSKALKRLKKQLESGRRGKMVA